MADSSRERILNWIGFGLLIACFTVSIVRITLLRPARPPAEGSDRVTIRVAHWQLEGGVRQAFDEVAREYMRRNPGVRVLQLPVPERIFTNWLITQLVGGTAPDIIAMGMGMTDERRARFFEPITDMVERPNPYNKGTALEHTPLRETFLDGLESGFSSLLLEYYGLPLSVHTVRMYYNLDLLREITGAEDLPRTYEELTALADRAAEYAASSGRKLFPIAGSKYNSPVIMFRLFASQTEQLGERLAYDFLANRPSASFVAEGAADGAWSLESPEIRAGLELCRDLGRHMQPGFLTIGRDDASFFFVQGKTLMIATGSWDITSILSQVNFRVGVGLIPTPAAGDPRAPFTLGPIADPGAMGSVVMGLTRNSRHPEVARDFLLFLASQPANQIFADISRWPPSVVGVKPAPAAEPFTPFLEGYLGGFNLNFAGADTGRVFNTSMNNLTGAAGSVDRMIAAMSPGYLQAIRSDIGRQVLDARAAARRSDTTLGALAWMAAKNPEDSRIHEKLDLLLQSVAGGDFHARRLQRAAHRLSETR